MEANARRAAGMWSRQRAGRQGMAWQGKTRPLWQNGPVMKLTGTGLAVKQPADDVAGTTS